MKYTKAQYSLGILRITLGSIFLWAFFDKLLGLGFTTSPEKSWLAGNSPTLGFLSNTKGVFSSFFQSLAGNGWVDWLFMLGLFGIGLALILGIALRIATSSGALLLLLMWLASLPLTNHPLVDDHIIYILVLAVLCYSEAGHFLGLGKKWSQTKMVRQFSFLE